MGPLGRALLQLQALPSLLLGVFAFSIHKVQNRGDHVPAWAQADLRRGSRSALMRGWKRPEVPASWPGGHVLLPGLQGGRSSWEQRSNSCLQYSLSYVIILLLDDVIMVFSGNVCHTRLFHLLRSRYIYVNHFRAFSPRLLPQIGLLFFSLHLYFTFLL